MRIVIVGDGKIGSALAEQLSREGHEITIVDRSGTPLQRTVEDLDILSVEGNGATYATQIEAGVDEADLDGAGRAEPPVLPGREEDRRAAHHRPRAQP